MLKKKGSFLSRVAGAFAIIAVCSLANAQMYSCKQPNGSTTLRSEPCSASEKGSEVPGLPPPRTGSAERDRNPGAAGPTTKPQAAIPASVPAPANTPPPGVTTAGCVNLPSFVNEISAFQQSGASIESARSLVDRGYPAQQAGPLKEVVAILYSNAPSSPKLEAQLGAFICKPKS